MVNLDKWLPIGRGREAPKAYTLNVNPTQFLSLYRNAHFSVFVALSYSDQSKLFDS